MKMPLPLTAKQREVLCIIVRHYRHVGEMPSQRYVARRLGVHLKTVQEHLTALHAKGWLTSPTPQGIRCPHEPAPLTAT